MTQEEFNEMQRRCELARARSRLSKSPAEINPAGSALPIAEPERPVRNGTIPTAQNQKENPGRYKVSVASFRKRLIDPDNLVAKYHIDALRYEGLIPDDSAKHIVLEVQQFKAKDYERTEIEIVRLT